ncbi:hypothetical protein [Roseibacillus persicicus]|uniref:hypothetical protein n=1 Tax=Roseibacillus persicicus TaxID=454148 RepID=UPI00280D25A1|nr:hypothetical protein [Roseibacillus persicicus]MDQ8189167.1 hypothetical protein [Roseibacillus persicicus]
MMKSLCALSLFLVAAAEGQGLKGQWEVPTVSAKNLDQWQEFIFPSGQELAWRNIRWHRELEFAADEARELGRPVLLWTMNGHPAGET